MAQQIVDIGTTPNDGTGDPLRDAFDKTNDNFTELYNGKLESIQAGTNITVDDTDPQNPIVSASGGGGASSWGDLTGTLSDQTDLQAALDLKEALYRTFDRKTGNYGLVLADASKGIEMNVGSANTVTVPLNATQAFPINTLIPIAQYGAGLTSIVATGGVTIRTSAGNLDSPGQYSPMFLKKIATDEWYLWNGTASVGGGGTVTVAGTSGGVPYFSSSSTWASSAALAANALVVGGGAGSAPATVTTGTGVLTALAVNVGTDGAFVVKGGVLGTPSDNTIWKVGGNTLTGDSVLGGSSGAFGVNIQTNGSTRYAISSLGLHTFTQSAQAASNDFATFTQAVHTSGVAKGLVWTGGAHTGSTASTEHLDWDINLSGTITKATGAITTQRSVLFRGRTFTASGASLITNLVNVEIEPPVIAGSVTATNIHSLRSSGGWVTSVQTAATTQGFMVVQSSNVATWNFGTSNTMRLTSTSSMNIGPTSSGILQLTSARSISYQADANQVTIAHNFLSTNTVSTAGKTFVSYACTWTTVPAGDNTLMVFDPTFVETAAVASNYYALNVTGTLNFGASPTGNYYGLRIHPTITGGTLNSIIGYGVIVDSPLMKNGFGLAAPTAILHLAAGTTTLAPFKFTSGTNLTTAQNGAMEYNGTNLFFTRTGAVREGVLTQSAVTTEVIVSDTSVTVNIGGVSYKLLARA